MYKEIRLSSNSNGNFDIIVVLDRDTPEFSWEFFENINNKSKYLLSDIKKIASGRTIKNVKFIITGAVVATMAFSALFALSAEANSSGKYLISYVYTGTPAQQMEYIDAAGGQVDTVAPSYFNILGDGSLSVNINTGFVNQMHQKGVRVVPFLSNHWNRQAGIKALEDTEQLSEQLAAYIEQYNLDGINIDVENVTHLQKGQYTELVKKLREKIPDHKEVSVAVAANPYNYTTGWHGSYDYTNLAKYADYLMIMAYDESYEGGVAGPVASINFVENSIKYALNYAPPEKIVLGIPFFGRIWSEDNNFNGQGVNLALAESIFSDFDVMRTYNTSYQSPKAEFEIKVGEPVRSVNGKTLIPGEYTVWYENEISLKEKLVLVNKYNLKGSGTWAIGGEITSVWNNYSNWMTGSDLEADIITPGTSSAYKNTISNIPENNNINSGENNSNISSRPVSSSEKINSINTKTPDNSHINSIIQDKNIPSDNIGKIITENYGNENSESERYTSVETFSSSEQSKDDISKSKEINGDNISSNLELKNFAENIPNADQKAINEYIDNDGDSKNSLILKNTVLFLVTGGGISFLIFKFIKKGTLIIPTGKRFGLTKVLTSNGFKGIVYNKHISKNKYKATAIVEKDVEIRSTPSPAGEICGYVLKGECVEILELNNRYIKIYNGTLQGYVSFEGIKC